MPLRIIIEQRVPVDIDATVGTRKGTTSYAKKTALIATSTVTRRLTQDGLKSSRKMDTSFFFCRTGYFPSISLTHHSSLPEKKNWCLISSTCPGRRAFSCVSLALTPATQNDEGDALEE